MGTGECGFVGWDLEPIGLAVTVVAATDVVVGTEEFVANSVEVISTFGMVVPFVALLVVVVEVTFSLVIIVVVAAAVCEFAII